MPDFAIVPAGQENKMQITDQMRKDALAAAGSIDAGGRLPGLYLCQSNGDLVKEGKAKDKDWVLSSGDDNVINVGPAPMFIVLSAQTRYRMTVGEDDDKHIVWDAAKGHLTDAQNNDLMAKRAKRYTAFILIHVAQTGIDPHKLGPISYNAKGMATLAGMKWADAVANAALRGIPPFTLLWTLGCKLEKAIQGKGSWNVLTHEGPLSLNVSPQIYDKLKQSWQFADAKSRQGTQMQVAEAAPQDSAAEQADIEAVRRVAERDAQNNPPPVEDGPADTGTGATTIYATELPQDDGANINMMQVVVGNNDMNQPVKMYVGDLNEVECKTSLAYYHKFLRDWPNSTNRPQVEERVRAVNDKLAELASGGGDSEPPF